MVDCNMGQEGEMQSELSPSDFIVEFASGGPKNYAYRLITNEGEKTACKFKVSR